MSTETYNGWTNYETWSIALHLDNDEGTYNEARERARMAKEDAPDDYNVSRNIWTEQQAARFQLADWLKDYSETLCGIGSESEDYGIPEPTLLAQQLISGALSGVNWEEIADHYLSED